jgi:putative transposase
MTHHVHLLAAPQPVAGISYLMQWPGQRHAGMINRNHRRTGTWRDGRYKAGLIDTAACLLACMRHIEMNPLRAQMVIYPAEYAWSRHRHNAEGKTGPVITHHPRYTQPGRDRSSRCHAWREPFSTHIAPGLLHEIRHTANQALVLGTGALQRQAGSMLKRQTGENKQRKGISEKNAR